jgi:hypothetical protein
LKDTKLIYKTALLYANSKLSEKVRKAIPFPVDIFKNLVINLAKEVKDLYNENDKTFMKEIEEDTKKWKEILYFATYKKPCKNQY